MSFRNRAKCRNCGDIIESRHRHDFVTCTCHIEWNSKSHALLKEFITATKTATFGSRMTTFHDYDYNAFYADPRCIELQANVHGFSLDGGPKKESGLDDSRVLGNENDIEWLHEDTVEDQIQRIY